jgi:hypothetical protein
MKLESIHHVLNSAATTSQDATTSRAALLKRMVWIMLSEFDFGGVVWPDDDIQVRIPDDGIDEYAAVNALPRGPSRQEVSSRCSEAFEFQTLFENHGIDVQALCLPDSDIVKAILEAPLPAWDASTDENMLDWVVGGFIPQDALIMALKVAFADDPTVEKSTDELKNEIAQLKARLSASVAQINALKVAAPDDASTSKGASKRARSEESVQFPTDVYNQIRAKGKAVIETASNLIVQQGLDVADVDAVITLIKTHGEFVGLNKNNSTSIRRMDAAALQGQDLEEYALKYDVSAALTYHQLRPNRSYKPGCCTTFLGIEGIDLAHGTPIIRFLKAKTPSAEFPPLIQYKRKKSYTSWMTFGNIPENFPFKMKTGNGQDIVKDVAELPSVLFPLVPVATSKKQRTASGEDDA